MDSTMGEAGSDSPSERQDGRKPEEVRELDLRLGAVSQASGSAYVEMGKTKVVCSVYGPREQRGGAIGGVGGTMGEIDSESSGQLRCDVRMASFAMPQGSVAGLSSRERQDKVREEERKLTAALLRSLTSAVNLEAFPKASVDCYCTVLEINGSELSALVTAASLALTEAHVPALDLVSCATAAVVKNTVLLDPTEEEEKAAQGVAVVSYLASREEVCYVRFGGQWAPKLTDEGLELLLDGARQMDEQMRESIRSYFKEE